MNAVEIIVQATSMKPIRDPDSYGVLKIDLKPRLWAGALLNLVAWSVFNYIDLPYGGTNQ